MRFAHRFAGTSRSFGEIRIGTYPGGRVRGALRHHASAAVSIKGLPNGHRITQWGNHWRAYWRVLLPRGSRRLHEF
jgi:hypothetical protein